MKRNLFLAAICLLCLMIIAGCTSSRRINYDAIMYVSKTNGVREYITLRFDGQFFYNRPAINRSICGRWEWEENDDTYILHPDILYYFENDSIIAEKIQGMTKAEVPDPYWATMLLRKKTPYLHFIDVTDYAEIFPDSVLPPSLPGRVFKLVK